MIRIKKYDEIIEAGERGERSDMKSVNYDVYRAYWDSLKCGAETINFDGCIYEDNVKGIVETLRMEGVDRISITSGYSGLLGVLAEFEAQGCKFEGMTVSKVNCKDFHTGDYEVKPAALLVVEPNNAE